MPYYKSRSDLKSSQYSVFYPVMILVVGLGIQAISQVIILADQREKVNHGIELIDPNVKMALYEKNQFYSIASHLLRLAAKNKNAEQVVQELQLRKLQAAQPALMSMTEPPAIPAPIAANSTNADDPNTMLLPPEATDGPSKSPNTPDAK